MNGSLPLDRGDGPGLSPGGTGRRRSPWLVGLILLAATLGGTTVGVLAYAFWPLHEAFYTDADTIREDSDVARVRDVLWQPPKMVAELSELGSELYEPRISADGSTLFFVRGKAGDNADIYVARRTLDGWVDPQPLEGINTPDDDLGPQPSHDGRQLYFYSNRLGGFGGYDLWVAQRLEGEGDRVRFGEPMNLGPAVNSPFNEYVPALTASGDALYFASNRPQPSDTAQPDPGAWPGTVREDLFHRTYDLYVAAIGDAGVQTARPLAALNTPYNEGSPAVTPSGDFLYFASDRPGGSGAFDLYRTRRLSGEHLSAENLGPAVNSIANDLDPALGMDGFALLFSSDRPAHLMGGAVADGTSRTDTANDTTAAPPYRLYNTVSREVFLDTRTYRREFDWAAFLWNLGTGLLWTLLALLLLLALLALARDLRARKLSLLARCLLASLALHLLLLFLLSIWHVTASILGPPRAGGGVQVALAAPAKGQDLAKQIRGRVVEELAAALPELNEVRSETPVLRKDVLSELAEVSSAFTPIKAPRDVVPLEELREAPAFEPRSTSFTPDLSVDITPVPIRGSLALPETAVPIRLEEERPPDQPNVSASEPRLPDFPVIAGTTEFTLQTIDPERLAPRISDTHDGEKFAAIIPAQIETSPQEGRPSPRRVTLPSLQQTLMEWPDITMPLTEPRPIRSPETATLDVSAAELLGAALPPRAAHVSTALSASDTVRVEPAPASWQPESKPTTLNLEPAHDSQPPKSPTAFAPPMHEVPPAMPSSDAALTLALPNSAPITRRDETTDNAAPPTFTRSADPLRADLPVSSAPAQFELIEIEPIAPLGNPEYENARDRIAIAQPPTEAKPRPSNNPNTLSPVALSLDPDVLPALAEFSVELETQPYNSPWPMRRAEERNRAMGNDGQSKVEDATAMALRWLADHQSRDGHWDGRTFDANCGRCGGEATVDTNVALTSMSILSFQAAGHDHLRPGPFRRMLARSLDWLLVQQSQEGEFGADESLYSHALATLALGEALAMTGDPALRNPLEGAVRFLESSSRSSEAGWSAKEGEPPDTAVLGWVVHALSVAQTAGVNPAPESLDRAAQWLSRVSSRTQPGEYGFQPDRGLTTAMTAEALFTQQLLGRRPDEPLMRASASLIMHEPPDWKREPNTYLWYFASMALQQHSGEGPLQWISAATRELIENQRKQGPARGSWDPIGQWSQTGGRVYQTALCVLILQTPWRYPIRVETGDVPDVPEDAIGIVQGRVVSAEDGQPLPSASVRLDLPDRPAVVVRTDGTGHYQLFTPELPPYFALTATLEGYTPLSVNASSAPLLNPGRSFQDGVVVDFELERERESVVSIEPEPELHHLGDNRFDGRINSQFQKKAEGAIFETTFRISADQLPPRFTAAELRLLAKGVQYPHRLYINDILLEEYLDDAPSDGSFGSFGTDFDPGILREGENTLTIRAGGRPGDVDDFEFVNLQIRLSR
ncbi:MAG: PD40 domain-containing protein [Phycisphaerae bacterium]|nr:PD40 domain-containing protein [Phycisphaerae bacterium]